MDRTTYAGNKKRIEQFLVGIYTFYTVTLMLISSVQQWGRINDVIWMFGLLAAWSIYLAKYKTYEYRVRFYALLMQLSVILYACHSEKFADAIPTFMIFVVLIGLSGRARLIYITLLSIAFIFIYHFSVIKTVQPENMPIAFSQLANVLLMQFAVYTWTKRNAEGSQQLLDVIEELNIAQNSKDDFVANVSHEIRTPINTICGMSEIILKEELPYHVKENVLNMQMAGRNLMAVVSDILDYSELQTGKIEIEEEAYNITSTINDVINMTMARKNEKKIELIVDCNANIPSVLLGDEKKLRRVIMNLVDNAIKFTEEGCVSLRIGFREENYGINLVISVKDTGIGIEEENLEKLFTGFNQVDASRSRQEGGLGLGLAITNALVQKMGGALMVKSKPKKGTTVQVVVPQKVIDETPITSLNNRQDINVATFIDMEQFDKITIRDEYTNMIGHMVQQLQGKCHICRNLAELQRRESTERFSHIFISIVEYRADQEYFDALSQKTNVVVILDQQDEKYISNPDILRIFKPFYILAIVSVLNGSYDIKREGYHVSVEKFVTENAHVLAVDDNRMNLRVLEELLANYKIEVTTAKSGREALEKITAAKFDFVFMDHMMPEMDGVETLHRIRQLVGTYYQKVPIVALTANAVAGTREALLAEGFNDFMEKPIERSVLERVLKRNIPSEKIIYKDALAVNEDAISEEPKEEVFEIEGLDVEKGILYCNGKEQYIKVLQGYCEDWDNTGMVAEEAYEKKDWKNYTIAVHGLKSAMRSIGAMQLSENARKLEYAGKENNIEYILDNHHKLMKEYRELFFHLSQNKCICPEQEEVKPDVLEEPDIQELPEIETEVLDQCILEMESIMYTLDDGRLLEIISEIEHYQYKGMVLKQVFAPIRRKVEMSDYISAVEAVIKWKNGLADKESM